MCWKCDLFQLLWVCCLVFSHWIPVTISLFFSRINVRVPGVGVVGLLPFMGYSPTQCIKSIPGLLAITIVSCLILLLLYETRATRGWESTTASARRYPVAIGTDLTNPDLHYGVVVDCGSSGSRVYVYFWPPHNGNEKDLLSIQPLRDTDGNLVIKKITPGQNSYIVAVFQTKLFT